LGEDALVRGMGFLVVVNVGRAAEELLAASAE
jgi:hypothetical protein